MEKLIHKYTTNIPRYTSYPAVPHWENNIDEPLWWHHLNLNHGTQDIDLYIHIPYCSQLCYYCGCFKIIKKEKSYAQVIVDLILKEWNIYRQQIPALKIRSLHLGGGSPTFLPPPILEQLLKNLSPQFSNDFIGSCELDPRTTQDAHLEVLNSFNMKRISFGIQDFNPKVQQSINRIQPFSLVQSLVEKSVKQGFKSINFDLIYGLPFQEQKTFEKTLQQVLQLTPDLISLYSYAHVPWKIKSQNLIPAHSLPKPEEKFKLFLLASKFFKENDYNYIGLDHFAKKNSYLYQAKIQNKLQRNFMGYVDQKSPVLIGLGPSAISSSPYSFIQNNKDLNEYQKNIGQQKLALKAGHFHSTEDLITKSIIHSIMCHETIPLKLIKTSPLFASLFDQLQSFQKDGLLCLTRDKITLSATGQLFRRNIAQVFDLYHQKSGDHRERFGQSI